MTTTNARFIHLIFVLETLLARIENNPKRTGLYVYRAKLELQETA